MIPVVSAFKDACRDSSAQSLLDKFGTHYIIESSYERVVSTSSNSHSSSGSVKASANVGAVSVSGTSASGTVSETQSSSTEDWAFKPRKFLLIGPLLKNLRKQFDTKNGKAY